ncbi:MAG: flagellin [Oceanicaulis sp.]|uniref:flagellin n=1 Tax=Oceanicaulis TaxID=153232 RepID=UPI0003B7287D|nr:MULTISPECIES: flagellin [Oceanicaulis]MAP47959.1 flagellin [Oceanicaulis sp.]VXC73717.1 Flagellin FljN [Oceanicaulis sp. 350]|tara:strand:- start:8465 stop:9289 length:825 start_codon:yes stop_codon:yes gene_type:complete
MATINTNPGAMIALQNLNKTNMDLQQVQQRINTGLAISSAKDNGGVFAIAQSMRADVAGYNAVSQSLDLAQSTVDVALAAGEAISDLMIEMKEKALASTDASLDTASRNALNEDFTALRDQIGTIVANAEFNGTNLIGNGAADITALANSDGSNTITIGAEDLSLTGGTLSIGVGSSISTVAAASTAVAAIEAGLDNLNSALARLGTGSKSLEIHSTFVTKLSDALERGIGNLVDADLAKESARLQSLQVKQQLGTQALSIANSAPSSILSYFR